MNPARLLSRLTFFLPLLALGVWARPLSLFPGPYLILALGLTWARLGAVLGGHRGGEEARLVFQTLPFALYTGARLGGSGFSQGLGLGLSFFSLAAGLLALEDLAIPQRPGVLASLPFCALAWLPFLGAMVLPQAEAPWLLGGLGLLVLLVAGYLGLRSKG